MRMGNVKGDHKRKTSLFLYAKEEIVLPWMRVKECSHI